MMAPLKKRTSRRKPRGWESYVKAYARRVWGWSSERKAAKARAEVANGRFRCEDCHEVHSRAGIEIDHVDPCERIEGFEGDWTGWLNRLFCSSEGLRVLCLECHSAKTCVENKLRAVARKAKKDVTTG